MLSTLHQRTADKHLFESLGNPNPYDLFDAVASPDIRRACIRWFSDHPETIRREWFHKRIRHCNDDLHRELATCFMAIEDPVLAIETAFRTDGNLNLNGALLSKTVIGIVKRNPQLYWLPQVREMLISHLQWPAQATQRYNSGRRYHDGDWQPCYRALLLIVETMRDVSLLDQVSKLARFMANTESGHYTRIDPPYATEINRVISQTALENLQDSLARQQLDWLSKTLTRWITDDFKSGRAEQVTCKLTPARQRFVYNFIDTSDEFTELMRDPTSFELNIADDRITDGEKLLIQLPSERIVCPTANGVTISFTFDTLQIGTGISRIHLIPAIDFHRGHSLGGGGGTLYLNVLDNGTVEVLPLPS